MIKTFFNRGHERSIRAKKNIALSFIIKGLNILIGLVLVPLTINYINNTQYGIWLTLSSIVAWFGFFDIGLGNGLRNKLAEAIASKKYKLARIYISTTYVTIGIIIGIILLIFICINPILNWSKILNAPLSLEPQLSIVALIVFVFFCLQFILQLLIIVVTANQQPAKASIFNFLGNLLALVIIFILVKTAKGNLIHLSFILSASPVFVLFVSSILLYTGEYKKYKPSFKYAKFKFVKSIMSLGLKFFIIQVGALILYQTDNIVISQVFNPEKVTTFNIAHKYFSVISVLFGVIMSPFWVAFTDAYTKKDFLWIKNSYDKLEKYWLILVVVALLLLIISPVAYRFWVGKELIIPFDLSLFVAIYALGYSWIMIPCYFLNGIGKIKIQFYLYIICIIINIPLSIYLGRLFGLNGVVLSNILIFLLLGIILTIQSKKVMNGSAVGLWNA